MLCGGLFGWSVVFVGMDVEVWNLTEHGTARSGAVEIFNIVGRIRDPKSVAEFCYALNGGPRTSIYFNRGEGRQSRVCP